jgi:hypothetical protein
LLRYYLKSGNLRWRTDMPGGPKAGDKAGYLDKVHGYIRLCVDGRQYYASHIAWLLRTGDWPPQGMQIDHRDGNKANNRWDNLRLATRAQNCRNVRKRQGTSSPFKGVCRIGKDLFVAHIRVNRRLRYLGRFTDERLAARAYRLAAMKHHGQFARWSQA